MALTKKEQRQLQDAMILFPDKMFKLLKVAVRKEANNIKSEAIKILADNLYSGLPKSLKGDRTYEFVAPPSKRRKTKRGGQSSGGQSFWIKGTVQTEKGKRSYIWERTGHLKRLIIKVNENQDKVIAEVFSPAPYSIYVELGTEYTRATPFLGPAYAKSIKQLPGNIQDLIRKQIKQLGIA